ncbi:hypothetical protein HYR99_42165 [Candidatus Poribacteria bacterium]|nr:hypothetical protein [Candidatus Poribacteria bacterium]
MRQVGIMKWNAMNWLFPDFEDTALLYHGTAPDNLLSIFRHGLIPGYDPDPEEQHHTIYESHVRHRPAHIPNWVDPRYCIFGYLNRSRQGGHSGIIEGTVIQAHLGIDAIPAITERTWVCCSQFSDWVYCPREAGYFDTDARTKYYRTVIEPVCSGAYWQTSLSFAENLAIRHDQLLRMQNSEELLICTDIAPTHLSLQVFRVKGANGIREIVRLDCPAIFEEAEHKLRHYQPIADELQAIVDYTAVAKRAL